MGGTGRGGWGWEGGRVGLVGLAMLTVGEGQLCATESAEPAVLCSSHSPDQGLHP